MTGTNLILDRLKAKKGIRRRVGLLAIALDLAAILTAYTVASLAYLNTIAVELILRTLVSLWPIFFLFALNLQIYNSNLLAERFRSSWKASSALIWASLLMSLIFFFLKISEEFSRAVLGLGTVFAVALISFGRFGIAQLTNGILGATPGAYLQIVDGAATSPSLNDDALSADELGLEPIPSDPEMLDRLGQLAFGLDGVVVHCAPDRREKWAFLLKSLDIRTEVVVPELSRLRPLAIRYRSDQTSIVLGSGQLTWSQRVLKRGFDLAFTALLLPVLAPVLAILGILIKLDSKGPVFFRQARIGLGNRKFQILKFRTMRVDMLDADGAKLTQRGDPRITRIGDILRKTSLDELPQFINVLLGDMSIVGPRPHTQSAKAGDSLYWEIDESYWHRHVVKPGITGLAQVRGHRGNTFEERQLRDRLNADLEYVSNWSLATDFKITLLTLGVLVHRNAF